MQMYSECEHSSASKPSRRSLQILASRSQVYHTRSLIDTVHSYYRATHTYVYPNHHHHQCPSSTIFTHWCIHPLLSAHLLSGTMCVGTFMRSHHGTKRAIIKPLLCGSVTLALKAGSTTSRNTTRSWASTGCPPAPTAMDALMLHSSHPRAPNSFCASS
jgi:hypothetical protein